MKTKPLILLLDDDPRLCRWVRLNLEAAGYQVDAAQVTTVAQRIIEGEEPDMVILDLVLPGMSGVDFLRRLRIEHKMPVIVLSGKNDEESVTRSLRDGADDYVAKPFRMGELLARIEAALRRSRPTPNFAAEKELVIGDLAVHLGRRRVTVRGKELELTPTEYKLLAELAANPGQVVLHHELLSRIWGSAYRDEWEYVRTYIGRLRRKLEVDASNPEYILSKPGFGYYLRSPSQPAPSGPQLNAREPQRPPENMEAVPVPVRASRS